MEKSCRKCGPKASPQPNLYRLRYTQVYLNLNHGETYKMSFKGDHKKFLKTVNLLLMP